MSRKVDEKTVTQLEARLAKAKAALSQKARKQRTARLIALGVFVRQHLIHSEQQLGPWATAAERYLDARQLLLVRDALAEIAVKRSELAPPSSRHREDKSNSPRPDSGGA